MMANGWAGDWRIPQLAYVALTSRVLERPMKLAFVAAPAAGKNAALDAALTLVPPEAVYVSTAASPTALIHTAEQPSSCLSLLPARTPPEAPGRQGPGASGSSGGP